LTAEDGRFKGCLGVATGERQREPSPILRVRDFRRELAGKGEFLLIGQSRKPFIAIGRKRLLVLCRPMHNLSGEGIENPAFVCVAELQRSHEIAE
jgi:hypothetical protein